VDNFGHDGVTVRNGSLRQFAAGVDFGEVRHNRLLGISASRNRFVGIQLFNSSRSLIRNSSGTGSTDPDEGTGLGLFDSHHVRILNSSFRHNGAFGIILEGADRNQVRRNRSVRNGGFGIYVAPGNRNVIAGNRVSHPGASGIQVDGGDRNVIVRNSVHDTEGPGINVNFVEEPVVGNVVRRNHVRGAGADGVHVNHKAKDTLLDGNHALRSEDDGIDVESPATTLTRNHAVQNGDFGIEAVPGVTDGGGNKASGNGNPAQCLNVVCK